MERREFLGAVGALTAGYTATSAGYAANETIRIGLIGTGGRCRHLLGALKTIPGAQVVAICDVWDQAIEATKPFAIAKPFITRDYHALLGRTDVDAVLIASPDHWHVPMAVDACKAGKDVYVEKPLTHDVKEGAAIVSAQNDHKRIVQVGMQQRSMPHFQKGFEIIRSGKLGTIHKVHLTWNRNQQRASYKKIGIEPGKALDWKGFLGSAKDQPFDEYRFRNWRWFWDFGGGILTDLMVHYIDVANWYLGLANPETAVTVGDHFHTAGLWETPDTIQTLLRYPDQKTQIYFEGTFVNARNAAMLEFMGTEGTLYLDRGRFELHPEPGRSLAYEEWILGKGKRGADFYDNPPGEALHLANWLECVRNRKSPNAPAEAGVAAVLGAHLGNHAYRNQKQAQWSDLAG